MLSAYTTTQIISATAMRTNHELLKISALNIRYLGMKSPEGGIASRNIIPTISTTAPTGCNLMYLPEKLISNELNTLLS